MSLFRPAFGRPFGTWGGLTAKPSVETLGYSRMSLRDKDRRPGQGSFREGLGPGAAGYAEAARSRHKRLLPGLEGGSVGGRSSTGSAFTLVEVLLALAICAIVLAAINAVFAT